MSILSRRWEHVVVMTLLVSAIALGEGCQRKTRFVPAQADSTSVDSMTVHLRQSQERWETEGAGDEAAALSAQALAENLRIEPWVSWKERADALLDSLSIGAETAQATCALAVNFFARSDPTGGSWPYLFWCGEKSVRYQPVEGRGLHLIHLVTRDLVEGGRPLRVTAKAKRKGTVAASSQQGARPSTPAAAAIFASRGGGGQQPLLMAWRQGPAGDRWDLAQTLGADSLGGIGTAEFESRADTFDLVARTYRNPREFEECATCPHVFRVHRFRWRVSEFERVEDKLVPSTYSTFVQFIQALMANNPSVALASVADSSLMDAARRLEWDRPKGIWRVAPATDETPQRMVFFRGQKEAYQVRFEPRGTDWLISGFEPIPRTVE